MAATLSPATRAAPDAVLWCSLPLFRFHSDFSFLPVSRLGKRKIDNEFSQINCISLAHVVFAAQGQYHPRQRTGSRDPNVLWIIPLLTQMVLTSLSSSVANFLRNLRTIFF